jgi:hypothetical protein
MKYEVQMYLLCHWLQDPSNSLRLVHGHRAEATVLV